jgi:hypothetical protein
MTPFFKIFVIFRFLLQNLSRAVSACFHEKEESRMALDSFWKEAARKIKKSTYF